MARELVLIPRSEYEALLNREKETHQKLDTVGNVTDKTENHEITDDFKTALNEPQDKVDVLPPPAKRSNSFLPKTIKPRGTKKTKPTRQMGGRKYVRQSFSDFLHEQSPAQKWMPYKI